MTSADPLGDASRRLMRSVSADGLNEIAAGLLLLSLPVFELAKWLCEPPRSLAWQVLNLLQMLALAPGIWVANWAVPRLRNRWFGARQGVMIPLPAAQTPTEGWAKALAALVTGGISAVVLVP